MADTLENPSDARKELLDALLLAIRAMNATPSFNTRISDPENPKRTMKSYDLLPKLEAVARKYGGPV
jgi:hypothetical protein